jgi:hypothetical protein
VVFINIIPELVDHFFFLKKEKKTPIDGGEVDVEILGRIGTRINFGKTVFCILLEKGHGELGDV